MSNADRSQDQAFSVEGPFDMKALLERCMGNAKIATLVLEKLAQQLPDDLEHLSVSTAQADCEQTAKIAHALKGAAGTVAAATLRQFASDIETYGREQQIDKAKECLADLKREVERCLKFVPAAKKQLSGSVG